MYGDSPAPANRPPYGVIVTRNTPAENASASARLVPAVQLTASRPPCTNRVARTDAFGNIELTSPNR
ncbi:hypothetical protein GCM10009534_03380 [Kribbella sandramycini]